MTNPQQNPEEIQLSIDFARRRIRLATLEIDDHVKRMNWLMKERDCYLRQIDRDTVRLAEAQRTAVAES